MVWRTGTSTSTGSRATLGAITSALHKELAAQSPDGEQGTVAPAIARVLIKRAISGDLRAIREIADRTEGRPMLQLRVDAPPTEESSLDLSRLTAEQMRQLDEILQAATKD